MNEIKIKRAAQDYLYRLIGIGVNMGRASNLHNEMIGIIEGEKLTQKETALLIDILVDQESFSLKQYKAPHLEVDLEELRKKWAEAPDINYEFEQLKNINNPKTEEMEREIIGYKFKDEDCYDKFITVFNELSENVYMDGYNKEGTYYKSGFDFPNNGWQTCLNFAKKHNLLEELFNPVYREEFKVGDIVVGWHNNENKLNSNAWKIGKISEKGKISKNEYVYPDNEVSWNTGISNIRKATPEEIEEFNKKENDLKAGHWYKTDKEKSLWFIK